MRKLLFTLAALFTAAASFAQSANNEENALGKFSIEMSSFGTYKQHDIREIGAKMNVSYEFVTNLYVLAHYEESTGLYSKDGLRNHFSSNVLGGGLGYKFLKIENGGTLDARLMLGQTIGGKDWKKTSYTAEVMWKMRGGLSPTISLGFSHNVSHTGGLPNMNVVYGSIGIKF